MEPNAIKTDNNDSFIIKQCTHNGFNHHMQWHIRTLIRQNECTYALPRNRNHSGSVFAAGHYYVLCFEILAVTISQKINDFLVHMSGKNHGFITRWAMWSGKNKNGFEF